MRGFSKFQGILCAFIALNTANLKYQKHSEKYSTKIVIMIIRIQTAFA